MNSDYDTLFHQEIKRVLEELYYHPLNPETTKQKRKVIKTEKRYVSFLVNHNIVNDLKVASGDTYGLQLESKGFEVFEKYNGWDDYKRKVIDQKGKIEKAKELSVKYWWVPIAISILSLTIAVIALIK